MMTISSSNLLKRKIDQNNIQQITTTNNDNNESDNNNNNNTTLILRKKLCLKRLKTLMDVKDNYIESITEHYYLKLNQNYLDYNIWKLKPNKDLNDYLNEQIIAKNDISILEVFFFSF
jgi:hypothetical protein